MRIFFSAGEPSGDLHGANLIAQLRQRLRLEAAGLGGPRMKSAGCDLLRDMTDLAVMGLFPALVRLPQFFKLLAQVDRSLDAQRPDAVVLIDYPGFNWHVARKAKERGIPVFYYGLPQLWAWASWRVSKVRRYVDHALCKLPFEEAWFRQHGCNATYIGHPYFDELRAQQLDETFLAQLQDRDSRLLTILPGSREREVRSNLPMLLNAAAQVRREVRNVRIAVASYNESQAALAREYVAAGPAPANVFVGRTPELISAADGCLACSGSVSLELLYRAKPTVIVYRMPWLTHQVFLRMIHARYITLVNLLDSDQPLIGRRGRWALYPSRAEQEQAIFPEYATSRDCSSEIARHAIGWLTDEAQRQRVVQRLSALRQQVAAGGASSAAADYITRELMTPVSMPLRRAS